METSGVLTQAITGSNAREAMIGAKKAASTKNRAIDAWPATRQMIFLSTMATKIAKTRSFYVNNLSKIMASAAVALVSLSASADEGRDCKEGGRLSFVEMKTPNMVLNGSGQVVQNGLLTLKGKYRVPSRCQEDHTKGGMPAVVILHGSSGVDSRGDFYADALNSAGIATLEIDMWEARGVGSGASRPALPALTYTDAFTALRFLGGQKGINASRVGVLGFSWGGVVSLASSSENIARAAGGTLRFKAHASNYPVCYAFNNPAIPNSAYGTPAGNPLTGAPILVEIGTEDDYDRPNSSVDASLRCLGLKESLTSAEQAMMKVVSFQGASHGWDRLMVPTKVYDPFGHLGADRFDPTARVELRPDVRKAYEAQENVLKFFKRTL